MTPSTQRWRDLLAILPLAVVDAALNKKHFTVSFTEFGAGFDPPVTFDEARFFEGLEIGSLVNIIRQSR